MPARKRRKMSFTAPEQETALSDLPRNTPKMKRKQPDHQEKADKHKEVLSENPSCPT
jgi:hypothetical protein